MTENLHRERTNKMNSKTTNSGLIRGKDHKPTTKTNREFSVDRHEPDDESPTGLLYELELFDLSGEGSQARLEN